MLNHVLEVKQLRGATNISITIIKLEKDIRKGMGEAGDLIVNCHADFIQGQVCKIRLFFFSFLFSSFSDSSNLDDRLNGGG